jgi:hypothetical protein
LELGLREADRVRKPTFAEALEGACEREPSDEGDQDDSRTRVEKGTNFCEQFNSLIGNSFRDEGRIVSENGVESPRFCLLVVSPLSGDCGEKEPRIF